MGTSVPPAPWGVQDEAAGAQNLRWLQGAASVLIHARVRHVIPFMPLPERFGGNSERNGHGGFAIVIV